MTRLRRLRTFAIACLMAGVASHAHADALVTNRVQVTYADANGISAGSAVIGEAAILVAAPPAVAAIRALPSGTLLVDGASIFSNTTALQITFTEEVQDSAGPVAATNPASFRLIHGGSDSVVETTTCGTPLAGDDAAIAIDSVAYEPGAFRATLNIGPLRRGNHRLVVCSAGIQDLAGIPLNGGTDEAVSFAVAGYAETPSLDALGLAVLALLLALAGLRIAG